MTVTAPLEDAKAAGLVYTSDVRPGHPASRLRRGFRYVRAGGSRLTASRRAA